MGSISTQLQIHDHIGVYYFHIQLSSSVLFLQIDAIAEASLVRLAPVSDGRASQAIQSHPFNRIHIRNV